MPKFGIVAAFYNCANNLDSIIPVWKNAKKKFGISISVINSLFIEYWSPNKDFSDRETKEKIISADLDYVNFSPVPLSEANARTAALKPLLNEGVDYVWLLDGDEFYTLGEIERIIDFVGLNDDDESYFTINFKNYFDNTVKWIDGFNPPRIFSNRIHGGISHIYWDNDILYNDKTDYKQLFKVEVPKEVAHVEHRTWVSEEASRNKIDYQMKHFGHCGYKWNDDEGRVELNEEYYKKLNLKLPEINHE